MRLCKRSFTGTNDKSYVEGTHYFSHEMIGLEEWELFMYFRKAREKKAT